MTYTRKADFVAYIQSDHLDKVIGSNDAILEQAIRTAEEEIWSHLGVCYDLTDVYFAPLVDYSGITTYVVDDAVWFDDVTGEKVYTAVAETLGNEPTDDTYWKQFDPRSPLLIQMIVDLALYHLHSRVSPRQIPELRLLRYEAVIAKLKKSCQTALPFPRKAEGDYYVPRFAGTKRKNDWYV